MSLFVGDLKLSDTSDLISFRVLLCNLVVAILCNPGVTHSIHTAFNSNAVGMEWVTPGLRMQVTPGLRMQWVWNGSCLGYECSG